MIASQTPRRLLAGALFLAAFAIPSVTRAEADMARFIPADSAFSIWASDLASVQAAGKASAFGKLLADPASAKIVALIESAVDEQKAEMSEEEITRIEEALDAIKGGAAFYIAFNPTDPETPYLSIVAELDDAGKAWFERLRPEIGKELTQVTKSTLAVGETTVYQIKGLMGDEPVAATPQADPLGLDGEEEDTMDELEPVPTTINYAIVADKFLYMSSIEDNETISKQIALITGANRDSIATRSDAGMAASHFTVDKSAVGLFLNAERGIELMIEEADSGQVPDLKTKLATIGALDIKSLYGTLTFNGPDMVLKLDATLPTGTRGVMDALFASNTINLDLLNAVPSDAPGAGAFYFDFARFWDATLAAVETFNPGTSSMINIPLLSIQSQFGVDPLNSILKNIKGTHYSYSMSPDPAAPAPDPNNPLAALEANNPVLISYENGDITFNAIRTLLTNLKNDPKYGQSFELEDTTEQLILRMPEAVRTAGGPAPVVSFTKRGLVFAQKEEGLADMQRTLTSAQPAKLGETAEFQQALAKVNRTGLLAYSYTSSSAWGVTIDQIKKMLAAGGMGDESDEFAEALPAGEVFTRHLGTVRQTVHRSENALTAEWVMEGKK
jgi:hypothetical protein